MRLVSSCSGRTGLVGKCLSIPGVVCLAGLLTLPATAQDLRSPSEIDGSRLSGDQSKPDVQQDSNSIGNPVGSQPNQVANELIRELDNLIPGEFAPDSEEYAKLADIVDAFRQRKGDQVVKLVESLSAETPDAPPADILLAALSYSTQDERTGLLLLERASSKNPDSPAVYSAFARVAITAGRTTDAKVLYEKLQQVTEASQLSEQGKEFYQTQYLDGMIDVAIKQQRLTEARALLEKQRANLPDHPKVLMVSAEIEFKEDKIDEALKYLQQMHLKYPNTRTPETILASWYQRVNNEAKAEEWIRKAAEQYPDDDKVQLEFASWALNQEDFPTASAAINRAEQASEQTPYSRNLKAKVAFAQGSYGLAASHYEALVASQPMDSDLSNMYALSLIESDDPEKRSTAVGIANRNYRAMPNNRVALAALGYIQFRLGQMDQAGQIFTKVSQMPGNSPEIDYFIASYLKQLGETAKAKQFVDRALQQEGLFMYRTAAKRLQQELAASELPTPGDSEKSDGQ